MPGPHAGGHRRQSGSAAPVPTASSHGLTAGEREAVYEAVVYLVRARLEKARSVLQ